MMLQLLACLGVSAAAAARSFYISPSGSDDADGTEQRPWRTTAPLRAHPSSCLPAALSQWLAAMRR